MFDERERELDSSGLYDKNAKKVSKEELRMLLDNRGENQKLNLVNTELSDMDLSGFDLKNIDFTDATLTNVILDGANLDGSCFTGAWFYGKSSLRGAKLTNCIIKEAGLRSVDLTDADISGSNMYGSVLEYAKLDGVKYDKNTKWYEMSCPPQGEAFIAWKCCTDLRVVQLLVPRDAKRVMATRETGRVNKAKVLSIKSIDETEIYDWAQSTVDEDFFYYTGKWVEPANGFQEDRWMDSSQGIHFFMTREQCIQYQTV